MESEWDGEKAAQNERKHGVPFGFATRVFLDENRFEWADTRQEHDEPRWITVGLIEGFEIVVAYSCAGARSGLSPQERQSDMSVKTTRTVKCTLNPKRPPRLTKK